MKTLLLLLLGITFLVNMETGETIGFDNQSNVPMLIQCWPSKDKAKIIFFDNSPVKVVSYWLLRWQGATLGWFEEPKYYYNPRNTIKKLPEIQY